MKEFQKKSLAMLFAMFMLGACSTVEDNSVNSDWKALVGGKKTSVNGVSVTFSADASNISTYSSENNQSFNLPIKSSSANGASYGETWGDVEVLYEFTSVTSEGGYVSVNSAGAVNFTFE